jgi:hypothetical protein
MVERDSRRATLGCSALGSGLPIPMGLADPLHLARPLHLHHPLHLAADADLVLDLVDPLHLVHPDYDLVLDYDSTIPADSGDDASSESSEETAVQGFLPDQSHHPKVGEAEDGGCNPIADRLVPPYSFYSPFLEH